MGSLPWVKDGLKTTLAPVARLATRNFARVLMYHRFSKGEEDAGRLSRSVLAEQLAYLQRHFQVVSLAELTSRLRAGERPAPYTAVVTVDDAYADFAEVAYPLFERFRIPVTLYVVTDFASGGWLWWDVIRFALTHASPGTYRIACADDTVEVRLSKGESLDQPWWQLAKIGLTLGPDARERFVQSICAGLQVTVPASPTPAFAGMGWAALGNLDSAIVDLGAHTSTHPVLARCTDDRITLEIAGSKRIIEQKLGRRVTSFCYPNGQRTDVDDRCIAAVRAAGFESAVLACGSLIGRDANLHALERLPIPDSRAGFVTEVSGVMHFRHRMAAARLSG
jgi:peptidoglycan/xylan/chitin deacetylase (PgdA/CDA1 family)